MCHAALTQQSKLESSRNRGLTWSTQHSSYTRALQRLCHCWACQTHSLKGPFFNSGESSPDRSLRGDLSRWLATVKKKKKSVDDWYVHNIADSSVLFVSSQSCTTVEGSGKVRSHQSLTTLYPSWWFRGQSLFQLSREPYDTVSQSVRMCMNIIPLSFICVTHKSSHFASATMPGDMNDILRISIIILFALYIGSWRALCPTTTSLSP